MSEKSVQDIASLFERFSPEAFQEDYDNSGLQVGDPQMVVTGVLITLDVTPDVLAEAETTGCNLIVSHHPVTLSGLKKITTDSGSGRIILGAAQKNIAIYSAHTNADSVKEGVSGRLAKKLGLKHCRILDPRAGALVKLVTFVPTVDAEQVRSALFDAGAGHIGNYDSCAFQVEGHGTFRGNEATNPHVGRPGLLHTEAEVRLETVFPAHLQSGIVKALVQAHPYEEPAYDLYPLKNRWDQAGYGIVGILDQPESPDAFLKRLKLLTNAGCIRHTKIPDKPVQKVAVCGGSGSFLTHKALAAQADVFISGDFKYHQFFETSESMMIVDIGHYESEQFTKELFFELLTKNLPNFAVRLSNVNTNPIKYY